MTNELPDLNKLEAIFHATQLQKVKKEGYACFTSDSFSGVGGFCFCDNLDQWKELYPAIIFIEALTDKDYEIYDPTDLKELIAIYHNYQDLAWGENDFKNFKWEVGITMLSFDIIFLGKVTGLFEENSENELIERLHQSFGDNPKENADDFLEFLDGYTT